MGRQDRKHFSKPSQTEAQRALQHFEVKFNQINIFDWIDFNNFFI